MSKSDTDILNELSQIGKFHFGKIGVLPERKAIIRLIKLAQKVLFPEYFHYEDLTASEALSRMHIVLEEQIRAAVCFDGQDCQGCMDAGKTAQQFIDQLPQTKQLICTDIQAIYDGDPAAFTKAEVILCYPGFYAICIYRLAHVLYTLKVPYIPRIMTEYAHEKTGVDINPGATIGDHFCIDHGTGIVIGETAVLGHHVKLYQGVTIGAKSFELDENGNPVKGGKRHPDIGDHVIIYANATILGGNTKVGSNSVIGGNVWLLKSVEPGSRIYYKE